MSRSWKDDLVWRECWRVVDGDVTKVRGFERDDYVYFGIDPDAQEEQIDERNDPRIVHVDDICEGNGVFELEREDDAKRYAARWLSDRLDVYQLKRVRLLSTMSDDLKKRIY